MYYGKCFVGAREAAESRWGHVTRVDDVMVCDNEEEQKQTPEEAITQAHPFTGPNASSINLHNAETTQRIKESIDQMAGES